MRRILSIALLSFLIIWVSYLVRIGFLATGEFNEPSDASEYIHAIPAAEGLLEQAHMLFQGRAPTLTKKEIGAHIDKINTHGTPLFILYLTAPADRDFTPQTVAPYLHAALVGLIFLVTQMIAPLWIALVTGVAATVYTPLFAFIYSWMPEGMTSVAVPIFVLGATGLAVYGTKWWHYVVAGILLFFLGMTRHVFLLYGIAFMGLWFFITQKKKRANILLLLSGYLVPTIIWLALLRRSGASVYGEGAVWRTLVIAHRLATDGWAGTGRPIVASWLDMITQIILRQNVFSLLALEAERIVRFLRSPANSYVSSFPFLSQQTLVWFHTILLYFALWGIRVALRRPFLLLAASAVLWNIGFVSLYYIEELRYQIPMLGILLLLAGAGIEELVFLWNKPDGRRAVVLFTLPALVWLGIRDVLLGIELWIIPFVNEVGVFRFMNFITAAVVIILGTYFLKKFDASKQKTWLKVSSVGFLVPGVAALLFFSREIRSRTWHEWSAPLRAGQQIKQRIAVDENKLKLLSSQTGYILIDLKDPNAGAYLSVALNGKIQEKQLSMAQKISTVDLMAVRQWQRMMPRLGGFFAVETSVAAAPTWPNFHDWLVYPITGDDLVVENTIEVANNNFLAAEPARIFGDYLPERSKGWYEGPTARIFQGPRTHNKYQVEGDMRLNEQIALQSATNFSMFYLRAGNMARDLSSVAGIQTGRYRIFFLFPYDQGDPVTLF